MASDDTAEFAFDFRTYGSSDLKATANQLGDLKSKIEEDIAELNGLRAALRNLKGAGNVSEATINSLKARLSAQKAVVSQSSIEFLKMGGTFRKLKTPTNEAGTAQKSLLDTLKSAPGPLGRYANVLSKAGVGGLAIAAGAVAVAAALIAVGRAAVSAAVDLVQFGFAAADARRDELLHLEGLSKIRYGYVQWAYGIGRVADKASFLQETLDKVSASTAIGRDKIAGYESQLYKAGLRGGNLQAALEGYSLVAATQGEDAANAWKGMAMGMAYTGQSLRALTNDVKARLGPINKAMMLSWNVQVLKFRENLGHIFDKVRIEPILKAFSVLTELMSQGNVVGQALAVIVEAIFGSFADSGDDAAQGFKIFIQDVVIGSQEIILSLLDVRDWLDKTFGKQGPISEMRDWIDELQLGKVAAYGLAAVLAGAAVSAVVLAIGLGIVVFLLGTLLAVLGIVVATGVATFYGVWLAVKWLGNKLGDLVYDMTQLDWKSIGVAIVKGIALGLTGGPIIAAIGTLGTEAWNAFKAKFEIHSPSKLFKRGGQYIAEGTAQGIEAGSPGVSDAVGSMTDADELSGPTSGSSKAGASINISFGDGAIVVNGNPSVSQLASLRAQITQIMEQAAIGFAAKAI